MLKILIAPSAFKGTLSPVTVSEAIQAGILDSGIDCKCELAPLADGGDGTLESLHFSRGGNFEHVDCQGPTGLIHTASWLELPDFAVVELATCSGLALIHDKPAPLSSHTFGLGQTIVDCLEKAKKKTIVCLGGSASTDGGTGALRALGAKFFDKRGEELPLGGQALVDLDSCDLSKLLSTDLLQVAVDVRNPLLGANGAARVFAPQKGADEVACELLENGLTVLADVLESTTKKQMRYLEGTGAAGGTAFGLCLCLGAPLVSGFQCISELLDLETRAKWADLIITAEGKLDAQSLSGKATGELALLAKQFGKRLIVVAATVDETCDWQKAGIAQVICLDGHSKQVTNKDIQQAVTNFVGAHCMRL